MKNNVIVTETEENTEQIVADAVKKRHPVRLTLIIVGAVLLAVLIGATVIAEPWVKPLTADAMPPVTETQLSAVEVTEGEKITLDVPLAEDEAIKTVEGAEIENDEIILTGKIAGEKTVSVVTEEKEAPTAPGSDFIGTIRAKLRGIVGIAADEYRTEKAECNAYTIPVKVLVADPEQVQGEGIALDFEENASKIIVCGETPVIKITDTTIIKATIVGYTVIVKPMNEQGGTTSIVITADGKQTTYPITVTAKPENKPSGSGSSSPSKPSGSSQSSSSQSSSAPATQTVTVAEVSAYVRAYAAQIGMTWDATKNKEDGMSSWGYTAGIPIYMSEVEWKSRIRESIDHLYSVDVRYISALVYQEYNSITAEYLY